MVNVRIFLWITAAVTGAIGLGLVVTPTPIVTFFSAGIVPNEVHFIRFLGCALIGYATLNAVAAGEATVSKAVLIGNLTSLTIASVIDLIGLSDGTLPMADWLILLLHLGFGAGFAYFLYVLPARYRA